MAELLEDPEFSKDNKINLYLARDENGTLTLYFDKPMKFKDGHWRVFVQTSHIELDKTWFPNVKWEDRKPTKVELTLTEDIIKLI